MYVVQNQISQNSRLSRSVMTVSIASINKQKILLKLFQSSTEVKADFTYIFCRFLKAVSRAPFSVYR